MASVINTEDFGTYIISKMYVIINRFVLVYLQFIWMFSYYCWQTSSLACSYLEEQLTCFQLSLSASFWLNAFCITVEVIQLKSTAGWNSRELTLPEAALCYWLSGAGVEVPQLLLPTPSLGCFINDLHLNFSLFFNWDCFCVYLNTRIDSKKWSCWLKRKYILRFFMYIMKMPSYIFSL